MATLKTCFKCGSDKSPDDFYRHPGMSSGRVGKCKECTKKDVRANYRRNREQYREYERKRANLPHRIEAREAYAQTPQGRMRGNIAKRRYLDRNPAKHAAHIACGNAIRDGRLTRQPCEFCGNTKVQAHHDDYSKPLDVRWLCTAHHAEWHKHNTPLCPEQDEAAA